MWALRVPAFLPHAEGSQAHQEDRCAHDVGPWEFETFLPWTLTKLSSEICCSKLRSKSCAGVFLAVPHVPLKLRDAPGCGTPWGWSVCCVVGSGSTSTFASLGVRWKKPTSIAAWNSSELSPLSLRCRPAGCVCSASGKPHQQLSGPAPCGRTWTSVAEPYPKKLCHMFATLADRSRDVQVYRNLYLAPSTPNR